MDQRIKEAPPSLVDLCVVVAINNIRYLGDVGETDLHLLDRILPHCTMEQLVHVEKSTQGRDLSPVTDKLWRKFFEQHFGEKSTDVVVERMKLKRVSFRWRQLYEAKLKEVAEAESKAVARLRQLYKKEDDRKQSRQIRLCSKVPPSGSKRSFCSGPGYNVSNVKGNLMKKAKLDYFKSPEVKNLAAMKRNPMLRKTSNQEVKNISVMKRSVVPSNNSQEDRQIGGLKKTAVNGNYSTVSMIRRRDGVHGNNSASSSNVANLSLSSSSNNTKPVRRL